MGINKKSIILIIILTSLVYANSLKNSFVWDDSLVIVDNDFVKSWKNFPSVFSRDYLTSISEIKDPGKRNLGSGETSYRPVVTASYFIDFSLWRLNPFGYHLTNLLLHIVNAVLVYFFLSLLVKNKKVALVASLLFALHPVNGEAVNCISFREDLLAFLFFISAFILFIKSSQKVHYYFGSLGLFLLALFSKEMAITLPVVLILYDYFFVFREKTKGFFFYFKSRYLGYIVVGSLYLSVWFLFKKDISKFLIEYPYPGGSFYTNLLTMSKVTATYIQWLFLPLNIHSTLPILDSSLISQSLLRPETLFSILLIISCFVIAIKLRRKSKEISFAILWFFITLIPVSNIFPISNIIASRYLYIPSVGYCLLLAWLLVKLPGLKMALISPAILRRVAKNATILLLVCYCLFTIMGNLSWRDNIMFWSEITRNYPDNASAHYTLGEHLRKRGLLDKAINEYQIATGLEPGNAEGYNELGICYYQNGMLDEAIVELKKALRLNPDLVEAYANLGCAYGEKGLYKDSIQYLKQAIKIDPRYTPGYNNLAITYAKMNKLDKARQMWERALEIDPECKQAERNLKRLGRLDY